MDFICKNNEYMDFLFVITFIVNLHIIYYW